MIHYCRPSSFLSLPTVLGCMTGACLFSPASPEPASQGLIELAPVSPEYLGLTQETASSLAFRATPPVACDPTRPDGEFYIRNLNINSRLAARGSLPAKVRGLVEEWAEMHQGRFAAFYLDAWLNLAWGCGFDVAPESLYFRATGKSLFCSPIKV